MRGLIGSRRFRVAAAVAEVQRPVPGRPRCQQDQRHAADYLALSRDREPALVAALSSGPSGVRELILRHCQAGRQRASSYSISWRISRPLGGGT